MFIDSFRTDQRKCPSCRSNIRKDGGCPMMSCVRCRYEFCWCCMGKQHSEFCPPCPGLTFRLSINVLISILVFIFLPVLIILFGFIGAFACQTSMYLSLASYKTKEKCGECCFGTLICLLTAPFSIILGTLFVGLLGPFILVIGEVMILAYLIRLLINVCGCCQTRSKNIITFKDLDTNL